MCFFSEAVMQREFIFEHVLRAVTFIFVFVSVVWLMISFPTPNPEEFTKYHEIRKRFSEKNEKRKIGWPKVAASENDKKYKKACME